MGALQSRVIATGVLFVFIFGSGVWLSRLGKPLNGGILTVHKLVSLAAAVLIGLTVYQLDSQAGMSTLEIGSVAVTVLLFVLTIATGGLLSIGKPARPAVLTVHRVAPFLTVVSTAVTVYLMIRGRL
jgi:hypothetical protein